ncbi:MAG: glycosyltransferase family 4 protein [Nitrososphaeraceae archaeon]|nr:glycosyltransferase family 4 protein [Nitrososphaeraceae archaeon]
MNVVMLGEYYKPNLMGGAEIQAMRRAEGLAKMGLKVMVVSFDSNTGTREETINGVKVIRHQLLTHKGRMLSLSLPVFRALKKYEVVADVYHLYNIYPLSGGGLYKLMRGKKPVIASLDNYGGYCPISTAIYGQCDQFSRYCCLKRTSNNTTDRIFSLPYSCIYPAMRYLSKKVDRYIAVSDHVKQEYTHWGFDSYKIIVIPNSIDTRRFASIHKKTHDGINILYLGRMEEAKGVSILIDAFKIISKSYENAKLILVGDGPLLNRYRLLALQDGLENKIIFAGHQNQETTSYYYSLADIFVHPAIFNEPFGITLLEAMAHQIPILVSDVGSLKNIVKDAGISFRKGDAKDLASKLITVIENKHKMIEMSKRSKQVLTEYDDQLAFKAILEVYNEVKEE